MYFKSYVPINLINLSEPEKSHTVYRKAQKYAPTILGANWNQIHAATFKTLYFVAS